MLDYDIKVISRYEWSEHISSNHKIRPSFITFQSARLDISAVFVGKGGRRWGMQGRGTLGFSCRLHNVKRLGFHHVS